MKVSIVIPSYNNYALLHQLLMDIYKKCPDVYEVIVVDDNSSEKGMFEGLQWWIKHTTLPITVRRELVNDGFLMTSNRGLKLASGDAIILISTDVRIHKDIVSTVNTWLQAIPNSLIGGTVYDKSTGWNEFDEKIFPYVEGYLLATTYDGWRDLGFLDERYAPNDFEDVDLSTTARSLKYNLQKLPDNSVEHIGAQSIPYGAERQELTERNREKFRKKWIK